MEDQRIIRIPGPAAFPVIIPAEPEPIEIDVRRTAVLVVDMQNAFVSPGGMFDLLRWDVTASRQCIGPIQVVLNSARRHGCRVIYVICALDRDLSNTGGPGSPYWYKEVMQNSRLNPEWQHVMIFRGTWGAEVVPELTPEENDVVVEKAGYSAFFGSNLFTVLATCNVKYLLVTGVSTNICVESTIRDACQLGLFPILISDGTASSGPDYAQDAALSNIRKCFGWVSTARAVAEALP